MDKHEATMSYTLETDTVKEKHIFDFDGAIKRSWRLFGNFVMAVSQKILNYFKVRVMRIVLLYKEMILT
jgi:hypothetical protein